MLGVSRQSVSKWETDGAVPELDKLMKLCDLFGVSLDQLTCRNTESGAETDAAAEQAPRTEQTACTEQAVFAQQTLCAEQAVPIKKKLAPKNIVGIVFLAVGLSCVILGLTPFALGAALLFGLYCVGVGVICLAAKRRLWLPLLIYSFVFFIAVSVFVFCQMVVETE